MIPDRYRFLLIALLMGAATSGASAQAAPPAWEQLSAAQREVLIAPLRDRYNSAPAPQRQKMLRHAERWQAMSPEQRDQARKGMRRFEHMSPEQREQARALFGAMRGLPPAQRDALRERWRAMTPEQRRQWVRENPPLPGGRD